MINKRYLMVGIVLTSLICAIGIAIPYSETTCTDSDGGKNYYVKGKGTGLYSNSKDKGWIFGENPNKASSRYDSSLDYSTYYDHCLDSETSNQLNEAYCDENGLLQSFGYNCPNGCEDGACIERDETPDCGDINCDGNVDSDDVTLLLNYVGYPGKYTICSEWAADVTCDGVIDVGDVGLLSNHVSYPDNERYALRCCSELSIEITNPKDKETVSGIVKVEATASGPNKLGEMFLTIAGEHIAGHFPLTHCIESVAKPVDNREIYTKTCWYNWDTSSWKGKVTLTASISDTGGSRAEDSVVVYVSETIDIVDVDIYPEIQAVEVGDIAEYRITVTDNHPIARCGIALADEPIPTEAEIAVEKVPRCIVYYTYNLEVTGLPFDAEYSESVTVYQGSSESVPLTIKPTYKGNFKFKVKATLSNNPSVHDSDSATLIVNEYRNCNLECKRRNYDYGVCRTSCSANEYDIGTRYCPQVIDKTLTAAGKVSSTTVVSSKSGGGGGGVVSVNKKMLTVEKAAVGDVVPTIKETTAEEQDTDIYMYPTYHCCCGNKGITVTAWLGKSSYKSGETATIYAKAYSTENGDIDAEVTGTVKRPDGIVDTLTFRKICTVYELQKIKDENPSMEISCIGGECWPRCLYIATYGNTEASGYYSVKVRAESRYGSAETSTGFWVREEFKTCNNYCQEIGYDYGVCRTSCRVDEKNVDHEYCPQLIARTIEPTDESNAEIAHRYMYCCCGNLVPPPPPDEKIKLELQEGWNLITLPGKGKLSLGTCEALYGFVYIDGGYLNMKEAKEKLGEEGLMEYLRKHSFWAYSFRKCYLEFTLEEYTSYTELELSKGWNLLPITEDMIGKSLQDIRGNCEFQKTYLWDAKKQRWEKLDLEEKFSEEQKFQGFIVKVPFSCSLGGVSIPSPPPLPEG